MDKNKIISILFWVAVVGSILFGVYRFFIARNFVVVYQIDCDPMEEKCFVWQCDESLGECTGDQEEDIWYYSKVKKMARDTAKCDPRQNECPDESICDQPVTQKCWIEKCDESLLAEGEECIDPETYLMQHPEALEEEASEEGVEEGEEDGAEEGEAEVIEGVEESADTQENPTEESLENLSTEEAPATIPVSEDPDAEKTETAVPY